MSLTRYTPLRSKTPLKRSGWLRATSPKRQNEYNKYSKEKKAYLALHPQCERCKSKKSTDLHHKAGRVGKWLYRYEYFAALCRECHDFLHQNGKEARRLGWIIDVHTIDRADNSASEDPIVCHSEPQDADTNPRHCPNWFQMACSTLLLVESSKDRDEVDRKHNRLE